MFDAIAGHYDLLNRVLSGGLDQWWRAKAVRALRLTGRETVLDLCTGTADVALAATRGANGAARVVGVDFSHEMLRLGLAKVHRRGVWPRVGLVRGDATRVPLVDNSVDAATIAFGIRNVQQPELACRELARVVRKGGRLAVLEFGLPRAGAWRAAYLWYSNRMLPAIGRLVSTARERLRIPARVGRPVSGAGRVRPDAPGERLPARDDRPADARDRLSVRGRAIGRTRPVRPGCYTS